MPKQKPKNQLSDKEQWKRFKEAAKDAEIDTQIAEANLRKIMGKAGSLKSIRSDEPKDKD